MTGTITVVEGDDMKLKGLLIGVAAIVGIVAATSTMTACGNQALGETPTDVPDTPEVNGNSGLDDPDTVTSGAREQATEATLSNVRMTCPDGWVITSSGNDWATVEQDDGDGRLDVALKRGNDADPSVGGVGDAAVGFNADNADEYAVDGMTWYGHEVDDGFALESDGGNGSVISVVGQNVTVDEAMELLRGITVE